MFGPMTLGVVTAVAVILQVYFVARIVRQDRKIAEREARIEKLRSELACADATLFRLNDRIADLESGAPRKGEAAVVPLFPEHSISRPSR